MLLQCVSNRICCVWTETLVTVVFAVRFARVARAVGEAVEAGVGAGDKGNWVWRSSRGWLGERARKDLNSRLYRITVDARKALEKVCYPLAFESNATSSCGPS